jgi:hypothetical protein
MKPRSKRRPDAIPLGTTRAAAGRGTGGGDGLCGGNSAQVAVGVLGGRPWLPYPESPPQPFADADKETIPEQQLNVDNRCRLKDW